MKNRFFKALALSALLSATGTVLAQEVNVLTAWYGQSCGTAHGNVTAHVKSRCDGKRQCDYRVDVAALGDAAPNCSKNFVVLFSCKSQPLVRLAQLPSESHGRNLVLNCALPAQPISN